MIRSIRLVYAERADAEVVRRWRRAVRELYPHADIGVRHGRPIDGERWNLFLASRSVNEEVPRIHDGLLTLLRAMANAIESGDSPEIGVDR